MKTKIISILKKELLIIEPLENIEPYRKGEIYRMKIEGKFNNWEFIGSPDEIKEEDAWELVEKTFTFYKDYNGTNRQFNFALGSFHSALEREIFWDVNPVPMPEIQGAYDDFGNFHGGWDDSWISAFEEAQEKTFDKKRTLILVKN